LYLTSARQAGRQAGQANVRRLLLTHLWPGTDHAAVLAEAGTTYEGEISIARAGLTVDLS
jgi:ribonuclease BN (tRNA processing enzyme)